MCNLETKTKMYSDGSTYKRQTLYLCPESDGKTPCISYRDSDERLVAFMEPNAAVPPVQDVQAPPVPGTRRKASIGASLVPPGIQRRYSGQTSTCHKEILRIDKEM